MYVWVRVRYGTMSINLSGGGRVLESQDCKAFSDLPHPL
jgi:hypothetical protein